MTQYPQEWVSSIIGEGIFKKEAICWTNTEGSIIGCNNRFMEFYGYKKENILGLFYVLPGFECNLSQIWDLLRTSLFTEKEHTCFLTFLSAGVPKYIELWSKLAPEGIVFLHRDITKYQEEIDALTKKCVYLEHASKIMRHDMHAGINTYVPRGISSLERRLNSKQIHDLKIEAPLKMIKEGLEHAQKVYKGVYEFTNLVKEGGVIQKAEYNLSLILKGFLSSTAYCQQIEIQELGFAKVNEPLFCTAIDNIIRNGLKYNDSDNKRVVVKRAGNEIWVEDNGRGMNPTEFLEFSKPYSRKTNQKEAGSGLGLDIFLAIMREHGFAVACELVLTGGTRIKITLQ
jgi:signal transduction histidine kinase